jgi:glycosyltransferase involved in cell wall biosynthesis/O-antigen/teichoic acid export membrane protein
MTAPTEPAARILHVINMGTTCGGAERLVADVAAAQRAAGHEVRVLSSDLAGSGDRFSDATWPQSTARHAPAARLARQLGNPAARRALADLVQKWRPQVVHLHTIGLLAPSTLTVLTETPTVLTVHGPEVYLRATERWCLPGHYFRRGDASHGSLTWRGYTALLATEWVVGRRWRRCLRVVDVVTAPSGYLAGLASADLGPVRLVPNGTDRVLLPAAAVRPVDNHEPRAERPWRVLFVGRLEYFKGPQVLVRALPALLAEHPDTVLTVCGTGSLADPLRALVEQLGLGAHVELVGWLRREELDRRMAEADVVVVPSLWPEAFGLTCLEALAAGTPVVASAVGALPDLVVADVTGLLVPPGEPAALATSVGRLLTDGQLRERLGQAGRRHATRYSLRNHVQAVADSYAEAIDRHARRQPPTRRHAAAPTRRLAGRVRAALGDSLVRNSMLLLSATVVLAVGGFPFWQLAAHLFAPADVGRASALIAASTLLANLALLGMNNSLIQYLPTWPDRARTVNGAVTVVALAAFVGAAGFVVFVPEFAQHIVGLRHPVGAATFTVLTVAGAVGLFYDNVFIGLRRCGYLLARNTLLVVLRVAVLTLLAAGAAGGIFTAYWLPMAVALGLYGFALRGRLGLPLRPTIAPERLRAMWRYSAGTYAATAILMTPNLLMPVLVVQRIGPQQAALYAVASLVASVLAFVPQATARSLFAEVSNDRGLLRGHLPRVLRLTVVLQAPLLAMILLTGNLVLGSFGSTYSEAYPLLSILAATSALSSVSFVGSTLLLIAGRIRLLCQLSAAGCLVSLLGAYLLAGHGLTWIGWSLLSGEAVLAIAYTFVITAQLRTGAPVEGR